MGFILLDALLWFIVFIAFSIYILSVQKWYIFLLLSNS